MTNLIERFTVDQWCEMDGMTVSEAKEWYGDDVVEFYGIEGGAVAGSKHADGTYSAFGCGMYDVNGITYEQMVEMIIDAF